jgi:hypothetical protein
MNAPGKSTRELAKWRYAARLVLGLSTLVLLVLIALHGLQVRTVMGLLSCMLAMVGLEKLVDPLLDRLIVREKDALRGADAEVTVGEILKSLPDDDIVLHDIPARFGNIDHLVFRRDGAIFLIETKSHGGTIDERRAERFISQTHENIFWLRDLLKQRLGCDMWINAAIVFPNAHVTVRRTIRGVDIVGADFLLGWMARATARPLIAEKLWSQVEALKVDLMVRR